MKNELIQKFDDEKMNREIQNNCIRIKKDDHKENKTEIANKNSLLS